MATSTFTLFDEPLAKPLSTVGVPMPGAYYLFYFTGGLVPAPVYSASGAVLSQTPGQAQPSCTADANGKFNAIYMDPGNTYRVQLYNSSGVLQEDVDPYRVPVSIGALAAQSGTGTFSLTDGTNSNTLNFEYVLSQGNTVCTLAVQGGTIPTMAGTSLSLVLLTGTFPRIVGGGDSFHSIPAENNGAYITAVAKVSFSTTTINLQANPITGNASWTNGVTAGIPCGFTITYNVNQALTEH